MSGYGIPRANEQEVGHLPPRGRLCLCGAGRAGADRVGVDHGRARRRPARHAVVGERGVRRGGRFGVVDLPEVAEDLQAFFLAEPRLQMGEQVGVCDFVAAPVSEDRADEREAGDRGGHRDRGQAIGERHEPFLEGVDAFAPGFEVFQGPFAFSPRFVEHFLLVGDKLVGLRARRERAVVEKQPERVEPGHADSRRVRRPEAEVQQQPAVLRRDPARAEHHVGTRGAIDVRYVVAVANDVQARPAGDRFAFFAEHGPLHTEFLGQVVLFKIFLVDPILERCQVVVEHPLVGVGGPRCKGVAFRPGREDLECPSGEVLFLDFGFALSQRGGRSQREQKARDQSGKAKGAPACAATPGVNLLRPPSHAQPPLGLPGTALQGGPLDRPTAGDTNTQGESSLGCRPTGRVAPRWGSRARASGFLRMPSAISATVGASARS